MREMPRVKLSSFLRVLIIISLFCLWLEIMLSTSSSSLDSSVDDDLNIDRNLDYLYEQILNINETSEQVLAAVPPELHKYLTVSSKNSSANSTDTKLVKNITEIREAILKHNEAQIIYNEEIYGPVLEDTVIIAIQVHTRLTYLRHLIVSLAQAQDIDKTLLVFSHDFYDEDINSLVRSIDFTKVMQIFYPYSIQTHPREFPGYDPNDCPRDVKKEKAIRLKCNNALHPDVYGHYREAKYTQTKQHWWWKANRIFNQLQSTAGHTGMVLFLEEDHYVAEDFLFMLQTLRSTADKSCPQCEILCLATYLKTYTYHTNGNQLEISPWHSSMHNMGFAFNRTVWNNIMELEKQFCAYDDYNWDYSLLHLSQNRPGRDKFKVLLCKGPRVFHIGECGIHHKKSNCNASTVISKVQKLLQQAHKFLYPSRVTTTMTNGGVKHNKRLVKGNGGWGDIRDQQMCTNMTKVGRQMKKIYYNITT